MRLLRGASAAVLVFTVGALLVHAWPTISPIGPMSTKLPPTWSKVKARSDPGALRVAASMALAAAKGDTLISFSIQESSAGSVPVIYLAAYSLETGALIKVLGSVKSSEFGSLGLTKGGMVSIGIPEATINNLA
ncbi:hypothetical protein GGI21_000947, partial [Coemansia aciculifera]